MRWSSWTIVFAIAVVSTTALAGGDKAHATKKESAKPPPPTVDPGASTGSADGSAAAEVDPFAGYPQIHGPKHYDLGHNAEIDVPAGMRLFESATAQDMIRKGGGSAEGAIAIVMTEFGGANWVVIVEANDGGYVDDSDADQLDANEMLEDFKRGTAEQNKKRVAMGIPALEIDGWSNPPAYDKAKHHLVWGLNAHDTGGKVINFFTRFLGRAGYLSLNLIDDAATIEQSKAQALSVLEATHFKPGSRYDDHASGDKSSGLGLKALVVGGGALLIAKKTGLLVVLLLFLKKGFIVVIAAIGGFFKWITGKKKKEDHLSIHLPPHDPTGGAGGFPPAGPPPGAPPSSGPPPGDPGGTPPTG
ncbi:MAG: DUF2167 domain-containing protein [Kofleriaceae bacterium]